MCWTDCSLIKCFPEAWTTTCECCKSHKTTELVILWTNLRFYKHLLITVLKLLMSELICLRFICVYPVYINSKTTLAEGNRIPTEKVCLSVGAGEVLTLYRPGALTQYRPGNDPVPTGHADPAAPVLSPGGGETVLRRDPWRFDGCRDERLSGGRTRLPPHTRSRVQTRHLIRPGSVLVPFVFQTKMHPREWNQDVHGAKSVTAYINFEKKIWHWKFKH